MERKDIAKLTLTAGTLIGLTGAVAGNSTGNALSGIGLITIALTIILLPDAIPEIMFEWVFGPLEGGENEERRR